MTDQRLATIAGAANLKIERPKESKCAKQHIQYNKKRMIYEKTLHYFANLGKFRLHTQFGINLIRFLSALIGFLGEI